MKSEDDPSTMIRRLRARHLELLQILSSAKTVHEAAQRMNLSQPAVTRMIREIEDIFGSQLFDRSVRGISANRTGALLMHRSSAMMQELSAIEKEVRLVQLGQHGQLRIGALSGNLNATRAVSRFMAASPDVHVSIREGPINPLISALLNGELDCVIGPITDEELRNPHIEELRLERLAEDRMVVVGPPTGPWTRRRRIKWAELVDARWILPPLESVLRRAFMRTYLERGLPMPVHRVEAISPLTTRSLLAQGAVDLGLLRKAQAQEEARLGGVKVLSMESEPMLPALTSVVRRAPSARSALLDAFMAILRQEASGGQ
ncbi:LysR family transcriptional regulator [Achromobacter pestifer]